MKYRASLRGRPRFLLFSEKFSIIHSASENTPKPSLRIHLFSEKNPTGKRLTEGNLSTFPVGSGGYAKRASALPEERETGGARLLLYLRARVQDPTAKVNG